MPPKRQHMDPWAGVEDADPYVLQAVGVKSNVESLTEYQLQREKERVKKRLDKKRKKTMTASKSRTSSWRKTSLSSECDSEVKSDDLEYSSSDEFKLPAAGEYLNEVENGIGTLLQYETDVPESGEGQMNLRGLFDFVIFNPQNNQPVSLSSVWESPCEAYGWVMPELKDEKDHERDDEGIYFKTSTILSYIQEYKSNNICIQTQYAFYNLKNPSRIYYPLYFPFYMREITIRLVLRFILDKSNITIHELVSRASLLGDDSILRRTWTQEDFESYFPQTTHELRDLVDAMPDVEWKQIERVPVLKYLCRSKSATKASAKKPSPAIRSKQGPQSKKGQKKKAQHTVLTPLVNALVSEYLDVDLEVVGKTPAYFRESFLSRGRPRDALIEEDSYKPGNFVLVQEEEQKHRIAQVVCCRPKNTYHVRWFVHGSETLLGGVAHGQELFLSIDDECRDIRHYNIASKCKVVRLSKREYSLQQWPEKDTYFYSSAWSRQNPADFTQVSETQVKVGVCLTCRERDHPISTFIDLETSVIKAIKYHKNDFIRYKAQSSSQLTCSIGQVISFKRTDEEIEVIVRRLIRAETKFGKVAEQALFMTSSTETIDAAMIIGKCQVLHRSTYECKGPTWITNHPDCFYVNLRTDLKSDLELKELSIDEFYFCEECFDSYEQRGEEEELCKGERVLKAFDPYIGVGGLGVGLKQGCSMQTIAGVEIDPHAAETARKNLGRETLIINDDASKILKQLVLQGKWSNKLKRNNIDILYSGPPCQNDSTLNRHKTNEKQPMLTALSYIDVLRPSFVVMEFVPGFFQWKNFNPQSQHAQEKTTKKHLKPVSEDLIDACLLKLVLKVMHFYGYNIRGRLIHARSFGIPQTRDRFFIIASSPEYGPLTIPEPTHTYNWHKQQSERQRTIYNGLKLKIDTGLGEALHEVVTVKDALSDLPLFDWTNPRDLTPLEIQQRQRRTRKNIPMIPCPQTSDAVWGLQNEYFQYETPPMNYFQRLARINVSDKDPDDLKYQHYTEHFPEKTVQNICDIPIQSGADYRHLPQQNLEPTLRETFMAQGRQAFQGGAYSRLDPDGYFHTITTNVGPLAKQSFVLHPQCSRILTIRELARAQGFPDDFTFFAHNDGIKEYHKQIGNSVPFGVSAAIGRAIQELVFKKWQQEENEKGQTNK